MKCPADCNKTAWFSESERGKVWLTVCTKESLFTFQCSFILAKLSIWWCRLFHKKYRSFGLPTASEKLWYPVSCHKCDNHYCIECSHGSKKSEWLTARIRR